MMYYMYIKHIITYTKYNKLTIYMQQQINMDPINNEIKEEEKNDSAISADDSNVNVNLSKRSFTNFASSAKKLMDLNEYIYEDNVLDLEKFHLNHDDELITLVHTMLSPTMIILVSHYFNTHFHTNFQDIAHLGWTPQSSYPL